MGTCETEGLLTAAVLVTKGEPVLEDCDLTATYSGLAVNGASANPFRELNWPRIYMASLHGAAHQNVGLCWNNHR